MADTLLLNADYKPHSLITWQEAINLMLQEKVHVVEEYDDWDVRSPSITVKVPAVVALVRYVVFKQPVKFNRANIYARDNHTCQYCGKKARGGSLSLTDLTFDHVIPSSMGGKTTWENITTACGPCNRHKRDRTPKQAGMELLTKPYKPRFVNPVKLELSGKSIPDAWRDYLYWTQEIESD